MRNRKARRGGNLYGPVWWQHERGYPHIPSDLVVDRRTAYIERSSALDFPLRHEAHAQDLLESNINNINRLKCYH